MTVDQENDMADAYQSGRSRCPAPFDVGELARMLERLEWMIDDVRDEVHRVRVADLRRELGDPSERTARKERALVILGLRGTAKAAVVLEWFDQTAAPRRVRLAHRLARRECHRRRQQKVSSQGRPSADRAA